MTRDAVDRKWMLKSLGVAFALGAVSVFAAVRFGSIQGESFFTPFVMLFWGGAAVSCAVTALAFLIAALFKSR